LQLKDRGAVIISSIDVRYRKAVVSVKGVAAERVSLRNTLGQINNIYLTVAVAENYGLVVDEFSLIGILTHS